MKSVYIAVLLLSSLMATAQKKYYATILDADNNPQARGIFLNASDTGVTIEVEKTPVLINTGNIHIIRVEKKTTTLEFMKMGASVATETAVNLLSGSKDSTDQGDKSDDKKKAIAATLQELLNSLLDENNHIASFKIDGSQEIIKEKLSILQQYSMEEEPKIKKKPTPLRPLGPIYVKPASTTTAGKPVFADTKQTEMKPAKPKVGPADNTIHVPTKPGSTATPVKPFTQKSSNNSKKISH